MSAYNVHEVIAWAEREGVTLTPDGDKVRMRAPRKPPDELLDAIGQVKPDLLRLLAAPPLRSDRVLRFPTQATLPSTRPAWTVRAGGKVFTLVALGGCTEAEALTVLRGKWPDGELVT